jgi:hypothetical protein
VSLLSHHVNVSDVDKKIVVSSLVDTEGSEKYTYTISYDNFKITQFAGDVQTMIINPVNSLYVENDQQPRLYSNTDDVHRSVSLGFYFPATRLFGLPEREDTFMLKNTGSNPYELFATDTFAHQPNNQ